MNQNGFLQRGFGQNIGFGRKSAIVVVDMLNAFTDPTSPLGMDLSNVIGVINLVVDKARTKKIPIFFSINCYKDMTEAGIWFLKQKGLEILIDDTPAVEIDQRINKIPSDRIIKKHYASVFFGTDFLSQLNAKGVDTLIITGVSTSGCVRATAVDAVSYGFRPIVVYDAVADRALPAHTQSLFDLQMKYADCIPSAQIIDYFQSLTPIML